MIGLKAIIVKNVDKRFSKKCLALFYFFYTENMHIVCTMHNADFKYTLFAQCRCLQNLGMLQVYIIAWRDTFR